MPFAVSQFMFRFFLAGGSNGVSDSIHGGTGSITYCPAVMKAMVIINTRFLGLSRSFLSISNSLSTVTCQ